MKKFYGKSRIFTPRLIKRQRFCMPEVPLTKSYTNFFPSCLEKVKLPRYPVCEEEKPPVDEHVEAIRGLSLWYMNHMNAMQAIQNYKEESNKSISASKEQTFGPHIDLENYLNSLKSRQKELSDFGKVSKAWDKYFEKAIPGWRELKQAQRITTNLVSRIATRPQGTKNRRTDTGSMQKLSNGDAYVSLMDSDVRDYLLNSAAVKNEQIGNINNEILFNRVYGKYFSDTDRHGNDELQRKKGKSKLGENSQSGPDTMHKKGAHKRNKHVRENVKGIDNAIKAKEREIKLKGVTQKSGKKISFNSESMNKLQEVKKGGRTTNGSVKSNAFGNARKSSLSYRRRTSSNGGKPVKGLSRRGDYRKHPDAHPLGVYRQMYLPERLRKHGITNKSEFEGSADAKKNLANQDRKPVSVDSVFIEPILPAEEPVQFFKKKSIVDKTDVRDRLMGIVNAVWTPDGKSAKPPKRLFPKAFGAQPGDSFHSDI